MERSADDGEGLGRTEAGNAQEGPARGAADGIVLQGDEFGESGESGGVTDFAQEGERADHQAIVGIGQQIFAVGVQDAHQEGMAIGAACQDAINEGRVDGIEAGHEEFVEQAVRLEFAGDGRRFVDRRSGWFGETGSRQLLLTLGIEVELLYGKRSVGRGERPVGEYAAQQKVSFVADGVGLDEAMGELRGEREVAVFFGGEGEEAGGERVVRIHGQRLA